MEENVAILMADLAGYTALTETHGGISAAETVERYLHIVKGSIVGDCRLHEQTGDEVMIVSHSADDLLATADKILRASLFEDNFLPMHGGLHFGKALKRNRQYFGTAVNLAARITSVARAGTLLGTRDFLDALEGKARDQFQSMGKQNFKNLRSPIEVFELAPECSLDHYIDPVCKMLVRQRQNAVVHPCNNHLHFCNQECLDIYMEAAC